MRNRYILPLVLATAVVSATTTTYPAPAPKLRVKTVVHVVEVQKAMPMPRFHFGPKGMEFVWKPKTPGSTDYYWCDPARSKDHCK